MNEKPVYIHYGHSCFGKIDPIRNLGYGTKPKGGLWASRQDDPYGWKKWCEQEKFWLDTFSMCFRFTLKDNAHILELSNRDQLIGLPQLIHKDEIFPYWLSCRLDFEQLQKDYDAIEITDIHKFSLALYGWDCNSILIMNPDIVEVKEVLYDCTGLD